ncbi:MAG: prepilin-type N-terminal cleavage/methylation domain-containing protein, partial [Candidatus Saccharibacteria bacterium]
MNKKKPTGFTIVELLVVIVVIGILLGLTIVGYAGWRARTAKKEVQSDLKGALSAMESARNFGAGYPVQASPPVAFSISTFDESTNVDLTYISGSAT